MCTFLRFIADIITMYLHIVMELAMSIARSNQFYRVINKFKNKIMSKCITNSLPVQVSNSFSIFELW